LFRQRSWPASVRRLAGIYLVVVFSCFESSRYCPMYLGATKEIPRSYMPRIKYF
jgi:hypothetical protein